jgi:hypothetical protein
MKVTVDGREWPLTLCLSYRRLGGGAWIAHEEAFWLLPTDLPWGDQRWWLVCPSCGLRRGVLYLSDSNGAWACRPCHNVAYASQSEGRADRMVRRLRKTICQAGGAFHPAIDFGQRPRAKGRHARTYARLQLEAEALVRKVLATKDGRSKLERMWG